MTKKPNQVAYAPIWGSALIIFGTAGIIQLIRLYWNHKYGFKDENKTNTKKRLNSLDTFRGLSIVIMIFANLSFSAS